MPCFILQKYYFFTIILVVVLWEGYKNIENKYKK